MKMYLTKSAFKTRILTNGYRVYFTSDGDYRMNHDENYLTIDKGVRKPFGTYSILPCVLINEFVELGVDTLKDALDYAYERYESDVKEQISDIDEKNDEL